MITINSKINEVPAFDAIIQLRKITQLNAHRLYAIMQILNIKSRYDIDPLIIYSVAQVATLNTNIIGGCCNEPINTLTRLMCETNIPISNLEHFLSVQSSRPGRFIVNVKTDNNLSLKFSENDNLSESQRLLKFVDAIGIGLFAQKGNTLFANENIQNRISDLTSFFSNENEQINQFIALFLDKYDQFYSKKKGSNKTDNRIFLQTTINEMIVCKTYNVIEKLRGFYLHMLMKTLEQVKNIQFLSYIPETAKEN